MKKALYLLAAISDRDFEWLLQAGKRQGVPKGSVLISEGQPIDALYVVLSGRFVVSVAAPEGDRPIAVLSSGEVLGEISFIDSRPPTATVRAVENAVVWSIPRMQLTAKLSQDVAFSSNFYRALAAFLSDRLRTTVSRLGYGGDSPNVPDDESPDHHNPQVFDNLELAKARLEWLVTH